MTARDPHHKLSVEELDEALADMAARRYMNAIGELANENVRGAMYEAGGAHALQHFRTMLGSRTVEDEWPGTSPDDDYLLFIEALEATNESDRTDDTGPTAGVH
jgi:hypothetical protein